VDGLLLHDPEDSRELAALIRKLISGPALRTQLAEAAADTAQQFTWDRNAAETWKFLNEVAARKQRSGHLDAQS
jgi:glycosyltransferase involved in cell wall biosynthesis